MLCFISNEASFKAKETLKQNNSNYKYFFFAFALMQKPNLFAFRQLVSSSNEKLHSAITVLIEDFFYKNGTTQIDSGFIDSNFSYEVMIRENKIFW